MATHASGINSSGLAGFSRKRWAKKAILKGQIMMLIFFMSVEKD
jgi:hypothetical protein